MHRMANLVNKALAGNAITRTCRKLLPDNTEGAVVCQPGSNSVDRATAVDVDFRSRALGADCLFNIFCLNKHLLVA